MANKGDQNVFLIRNKEELKNEIEKRLFTGKLFTFHVFIDEQDRKSLWDQFIDWDMYNTELIKQAFDKPNNSYVEEYKRDISVHLPIFSGTYKEPTFKEHNESVMEEIECQVKKLQRFYDKIDLLKTNQNAIKSDFRKEKFNQLLNLLQKFHKIGQELRNRRKDRETLILNDEYDVQDLLNALLHLHFDDIRSEDFSPSNSGANSRIDFVLKKEKIIIEVKMSNDKLGAKQLGEELLIDIGRYKAYPDCSDLVIFIYDKSDHIRNKKGLIEDLQKQSTNSFNITVVISPD